jgi:hypothetical protein
MLQAKDFRVIILGLVVQLSGLDGKEVASGSLIAASVVKEDFIVRPIGLSQQRWPDGTKTDRGFALCGLNGLSWERKYYDSN